VEDLDRTEKATFERICVLRSSAGEASRLKIQEGNRYGFLKGLGLGSWQQWMVKDRVEELQGKVDEMLENIVEQVGLGRAAVLAVDIIENDLKPSVEGFLESVSSIINFFEVFNANLKGVHKNSIDARSSTVERKRKRFYDKVDIIRKDIVAACGSYLGAVRLFNLHLKLLDVEPIPGQKALLWFKQQKDKKQIDLEKVKEMLECCEQDSAKPLLALLDEA